MKHGGTLMTFEDNLHCSVVSRIIECQMSSLKELGILDALWLRMTSPTSTA